ncbi:MAG: Rieske 2Fe-2S domain-containing protein [Actinomycetota bacterium]|nr:Rieske 2Fe-2S domain-containing protein [Actinomycetota bacterium]
MGVAIAVIAILAAAAVLIVVTANRHRSTTGALSRETVAKDQSAPSGDMVPVGASNTELEAEGRTRADDTRATRGLARRRSNAVVEWEPVDEDEIGVSRRQFLNRALFGAVGISAATLGAGVLAFLWPTGTSGFGGKVNAGNLDDILAEIEASKAPKYVANAKTYLQPFPTSAVSAAEKVYPPNVLTGMDNGIVALWQRCVHLGCKVPWCQTSQWFECPCHGSKYNRVGEKKDGPAPRGLDRFPVSIDGGDVMIDTGIVVQGPPIGTDTTKQQQEGPACI